MLKGQTEVGFEDTFEIAVPQSAMRRRVGGLGDQGPPSPRSAAPRGVQLQRSSLERVQSR